jgi:hypothetical protein
MMIEKYEDIIKKEKGNGGIIKKIFDRFYQREVPETRHVAQANNFLALDYLLDFKIISI